ncbi:Uncharacterized protein SCF082_LOCUS6201 [Durusdinium trenchii]|uniref:DUF7802 domain-containing protein n=1 Tax=Durusdinium trenchii TaxID=1381693 RepID=A0ABP0ICZ4_9DINO
MGRDKHRPSRHGTLDERDTTGAVAVDTNQVLEHCRTANTKHLFGGAGELPPTAAQVYEPSYVKLLTLRDEKAGVDWIGLNKVTNAEKGVVGPVKLAPGEYKLEVRLPKELNKNIAHDMGGLLVGGIQSIGLNIAQEEDKAREAYKRGMPTSFIDLQVEVQAKKYALVSQRGTLDLGLHESFARTFTVKPVDGETTFKLSMVSHSVLKRLKVQGALYMRNFAPEKEQHRRKQTAGKGKQILHSALTGEDAASPRHRLDADVNTRSFLTHFYQTEAPDRLAKIEQVLTHFENREDDLVATLETKYGVKFDRRGDWTPRLMQANLQAAEDSVSRMGQLMSTLGNDEWAKMPWRFWTSPMQQAKVLPTFVLCEWMYRALAIASFWHAKKTKSLPLWFSAWMCGSFNDIFFMAMPFCDNFWQAQACVMLTPRLPLYIVEMYAVVIYVSTTAARKFGLGYVPEAALCGVLAHLFYHVYDINGPRFLWWTWHDGDPSISVRNANAPIGSSVWILTYCALHALLYRWVNDPAASLVDIFAPFVAEVPQAGYRKVGERILELLSRIDAAHARLVAASALPKILVCGALCTPMFMSAMGVAQIASLDRIGIPGIRTYRLILLSYLVTLYRESLKKGATFPNVPQANRKTQDNGPHFHWLPPNVLKQRRASHRHHVLEAMGASPN